MPRRIEQDVTGPAGSWATVTQTVTHNPQSRSQTHTFAAFKTGGPWEPHGW